MAITETTSWYLVPAPLAHALHVLTDNELRVLLYLCRHGASLRGVSVTCTLDEFLHGKIHATDPTQRLDGGCGVRSRYRLADTINRLVDTYGYLTVEPRIQDIAVDRPATYAFVENLTANVRYSNAEVA